MAALNSLAVGSNPIGDEAMIQLLDGLRDVSLTSLDISKTQSGVSTATKLAELLAEDSKFKAVLASLTLSGNKVSKFKAVLEVVNVLGACPTHQLIPTSLHQYVSIRNPCMLAARISKY